MCWKAMMDIRSAKEVFVTAKEGLKSAEEKLRWSGKWPVQDKHRNDNRTDRALPDKNRTESRKVRDEQGSGGFSWLRR